MKLFVAAYRTPSRGSTIAWYTGQPGRSGPSSSHSLRSSLRRRNNPFLVPTGKSTAIRWVAVSGPAELTEEGADAQIDKLAKKYLGKDKYPWRNPDETRVKVLIEPVKVDAAG